MSLTRHLLGPNIQQVFGPLVLEIEARLTELELAVLPSWQTKDGRVVLLRDMTDEHLANTIKYCEARPHVMYEDDHGYDVVEDHPSLEKLERERDRRKDS